MRMPGKRFTVVARRKAPQIERSGIAGRDDLLTIIGKCGTEKAFCVIQRNRFAILWHLKIPDLGPQVRNRSDIVLAWMQFNAGNVPFISPFRPSVVISDLMCFSVPHKDSTTIRSPGEVSSIHAEDEL